jgi:hypothetical protein
VRLKGVLLNWKKVKMTFQLAARAEMLQPHNPIHRRAARLNQSGDNRSVGLEAFCPQKKQDALEAVRAVFTV